MGVSQVMEMKSSVECLAQVLTRHIAAKEKQAHGKWQNQMTRGLFSYFSCCDSFLLPIAPPYCILLHAGMEK